MKTPDYHELLDIATDPANKVQLFENGTALVTLPSYTQGIWISGAIIALWKAQAEAEAKAAQPAPTETTQPVEVAQPAAPVEITEIVLDKSSSV